MKISMFVYNDLKTDGRVKRSIEALKDDYDLLLCAKDSTYHLSDNLGYRFESVFDHVGGSLLEYLACLIKVFLIFLSENADIMYFHDCFSAPLLLMIAVIKKRTIKIYDAHELMIPDSKSTAIEKLIYRVEKLAIKKADLVVCASEPRKKLMEKVHKTKREIIVINNISILPKNVSIEKVFSEFPELREFMNDSRRTVIYTGFWGDRRIESLIDAAAELGEKIKALIVGQGKRKKALKRRIEELGASNVFLMDAVPYNYLYPICSECDVGFLCYSNERINQINCAPNKVYEYASAGLPVVANNNPGLLYYIEKYKIGISNDDLKVAIEAVLDNIDYYRMNAEMFIKQTDCIKEMSNLKMAIKKVGGFHSLKDSSKITMYETEREK